MLDGAGASTFLDIVDESNKEKVSTKNSTETVKFKEIRSADNNDLPFINITRDKARKKQIVFIDTQITDHESLISSFDKNTKVILINGNEDGFKKIEQTLESEKNYSAIHIIGHGSAGQILFGNALLTNDNIENYNSTLKNIGQTLTSNGDILFYGCNIAANEKGENLIKRISKITKADIAASDDITGNGGDWVLEKKIGIIETKNVQALEYNYSLGTADLYGIASIDTSTTEENHSATNFKAQSGGNNDGGQQSSSDKFIITQERSVVTYGRSLSFDVSAATSSITPSSSNPINVYMLYLNDVENRRAFSDRGQVTFEHEILGVFTEWDNTIAMTGISKSGASYPESGDTKVTKRTLEWYNGASSSYVGPGIAGSKDYFIISNSNKTISVGADNGLHGDFLRIITRASPPSAIVDTGYINEGDTLSVSNSASAVSGTSSGSHSGDVTDNDTDQVTQAGSTVSTSHTLTVTSYCHTSGGINSTSSNAGSSASGSYGTMTLNADGSYTYAAINDISGFGAGQTLTDMFTYTVTDGVTTDTATITITIIGQSDNNAPTASNSTVYINENNQVSSAGDRTPSNITKIFAAGDFNYSDSDSDSLSKVKITTLESAGALEHYNGSSWVDVTLNQEISASDIGNNYLRFTPAANSESNVTFGFKVNDGTVYSSSAYTMTISVNAAPNVTDTTVGTTVAAGNNSTGDVHDGVADSDDADSVLVVTGVASGNESSNNSIITNDTGVGSAIAGTYGTLTVAANGTYTYAASSTNNIAFGSTATDTFTYTTRDNETNSGSFAYDVGTITFTVASSIVLVNDTDSVNEDATVTKTGAQDDVLNDDAADTSGLTITHIKPTSGSNSTVSSGTSYLDGTSVTGTYGTLTIGADGSYTYTADQSAADALDASDEVTDSFTYTADGATATLIITVTGINDDPVAVNDTDAVNENATITESSGSELLVADDTDADDSSSLTVTQIAVTGGSNSSVSAGTNQSNGTSITGTYGTLVLGANGAYTYTANTTAAEALDAGDTATDSFTYTVSDGTATDTATLIITVTGVNDAPSAVNDTGHIKEGGTLTVANSGSAVSGTSTGSNTGDITDNDTDADASSTATITAIQHSGAGSATSVEDVTYTNGSATSVSGTYGTLTIGSDGSYKYVANSNISSFDAGDSNVTDVFTYTVSDGTATDTATLTITVIPSQDISAVNDTDSVNEDGTTTQRNGSGLLTADDTEPDSDTLTVTHIKPTSGSNSTVSSGTTFLNGTSITGTYGTLVVGADGSYTYTADQSAADALDASETATDSFTYTVTDGQGETDTATLVITVTGINDDPVAVNDTDAVNEDATITESSGSELLIADDTDADGSSSLTVTQIAVTGGSNNSVAGSSSYNSNFTTIVGTYGTLKVGADGTYTYTADQAAADALDASDTATDSFTYTVSDGTATDTATLIITVTGVNDAPVAVADTDAVLVTATVTDTTNGAGTVISDDTDLDESSSLTVTKIQHSGAGSASNVSSGTTRANGTSSTGTYGTLTIGANGTYSYVAGSSAGTDVFTYTVSDGTASTTTTLTITVSSNNNAPSAVNDTDSVNEDATVSQTSGSGLLVADDTDADSDTLTVSHIAVTGGSNSTVADSSTSASNGTSVTGTYGTLTVGEDGSYTYTADQSAADALDAGDTATDSFTYTISDGKGGTDTATLIITVTGTNDTPAATNDTGSVNEDATLTVSSAGSGVVQDNDTDADADDSASSLVITQIKPSGGSNSSVAGSSTYNSNGTSITGTYGTLVIGADGTYTYTADQSAADDLDASDTVTDVFTYTVTDTTGATTTADITITVTGVNDAPTASDNTVTTLEDTNHVFSTSEFNFSDVDDSGALNKIKITSLENDGALQYYNGSAWVDVTLNQEITATDIGNNKLRFVPDANENGTSYTSFGFQVSDGTDYSSSSSTMTVNVTPVNDNPVGVNDTDAVVEDATVSQTSGSGLLVADDTDADGDTLTVSQIAVTGGSNSSVTGSTTSSDGTSVTGTYGTLVVGADGSYTYVADQAAADALDANETATDSFTYTVSDGNGGTDTATLIITVTGANDNPVATNDTASVNEDATVTVSDAANGVIQNNDTDTDGDDTVSSLEITQIAVTGGSNSSVTSGTNQSNGTSVTGTYGTLVIGADGTYTYVADQSAADDLATGETATDSFTYTVSDGNGGTDTATIVITVTGTNDAPTAADKTIYINENNTDGTHGARTSSNITYTFSDSGSEFNFSDVDDNDTFTKVKIISVPTYGTLTKVGNGNTITANSTITNFDNIKYTPNANSENDDTFTFKVHDGTVFSSATYTMNISVNAAPVAVNDTDTINAGASAATGSVTTNDTDSDDSTSELKVRGVGTGAEGSSLANKNVDSAISGTYGTFTLNQDGSYSYDVTGNAATIALAAGATATDTFSYKVRDDETNAGTKAIDIGTITFTITGINESPTATNDNITVSTTDGSTTTVSNGSTNDLDGNDTDGDGDSISITNFASGSTEGSGTTFSAGSEITGTYGTLTLNADGSYTYVLSSTLTDDEAKNAGSDPVYDNFWYTISDGNSTDTAVLQIKIIFPAVVTGGGNEIDNSNSEPEVEDGSDSESEGKGKQKAETKKEKKQRRSEKIDTPELELPESNTRDGAEFNQGLRLVDLVAESESISTGDDSSVIENLKAKYTKDGIKVKFKVFNDEGKEMNKYYGEMKDGSVLPNWIKVDPKTGKTTTNIPKGTQMLEFKIVAVDSDNNQKKVTVVIDPKKIMQDKDVFKKIKKANKTKVNVDTSGTVKLQSTNEVGSIDKTTTNVLNNNKFTEFLNIEPSEILNVETQIVENKYYLDLPIVKAQNSEEFEIVQEDGQQLPEWIKIDPFTGQIIAEPPSDVDNIKLKIISEKDGGEIVVKEVELEFNKENNNTEKLDDPETTFEPLNTQLAKAQVNFDDYGDKLIRSL
mgnify:CR=1 FL=1